MTAIAYQYSPETILVVLSLGLYVRVLTWAAKLADDDASTPVTWW